MDLSNGFIEVPITNGRCRTSDAMKSGWAKDQFIYQQGNQRELLSSQTDSSDRMIWGEATAKSNSSRMKRIGKGEGKYYYDPEESIVFYEFYVGTEKQYTSKERAK